MKNTQNTISMLLVNLLVACGQPPSRTPVAAAPAQNQAAPSVPEAASQTVTQPVVAARLSLSVDHAQTPADGTTAATITVTVSDANNQPVVGAEVVLTASGSGNTLGQPGVTNGEGQAAVSFTATAAEVKHVVASLVGSALEAYVDVSFVTGEPLRLSFTVVPPTAPAGGVIGPSVIVAVQDAQGNLATGSDVVVTIAVADDAAAITGTLTQAAVNGVATFTDLSIGQAGEGYKLTATATDAISATSSDVSIVQ
jgi:hypothetical protein